MKIVRNSHNIEFLLTEIHNIIITNRLKVKLILRRLVILTVSLGIPLPMLLLVLTSQSLTT